MDLSKALDSINQEYISEVLEFLNFGTHFIEIVKTLLKDREFTVMPDGHETRGVLQEDMASPYLFF